MYFLPNALTPLAPATPAGAQTELGCPLGAITMAFKAPREACAESESTSHGGRRVTESLPGELRSFHLATISLPGPLFSSYGEASELWLFQLPFSVQPQSCQVTDGKLSQGTLHQLLPPIRRSILLQKKVETISLEISGCFSTGLY